MSSLKQTIATKPNRRSMLRGVGAGVILSPFLPYAYRAGSRALRPFATEDQHAGQALAAVPGKTKRLVLFCTMGTYPPIWKPTGLSGETISAFSAAMKPLEAIRENVVMIEGCPSQNPANGHGAPDSLTGLGYQFSGQPTMISIDQFVADRLVAGGINRPIPSLLLGANTNGETVFLRANKLPTIGSPKAAFNTVFSGVSGGTSTGGTVDKLAKRRKSILDLVKAETTTMRGRIGGEQRAKLDLHLESIRQLEAQLTQQPTTTSPPVMCPKPATTPSDSTTDTLAADLLHMDVAVNALACDITRVVGLQFGSDQGLAVTLPNLSGDQHSTFLHSGAPNFAQLIQFEAWLAGQFAALVKALKARANPSGTGTLFDDTLVVWTRDMGDADQHNQNSMRFVIAGGGGGYLKTASGGRYLGRSGGAESRHERVLLSILDAMGITDYKGFGASDLGTNKSPLPGIAA